MNEPAVPAALPRWSFRLYVAGDTPAGRRARANLEALCAVHLAEPYEVEVVDLRLDPAAAEADQVLAVPTVVRTAPLPTRRIIGDVSDAARALAGLDMDGVGTKKVVSDESERARVSHLPGDAFRRMLDRMVDGVLVVDEEGRVRFANPAAGELLGVDPDALIGELFGYPAVGHGPVEITVGFDTEAPRVAELQAGEIEWEGQAAQLIDLRDVTARHADRRRIEEMNSARLTVIEIQELILRADDDRALLRAACDTLLRRRDYLAAAVVREHADGRGTVVAESLRAGSASFAKIEQLDALPACCRRARRDGGVLQLDPPTGLCEGCPMDASCADRPRLVTAIRSHGDHFGFLTLVPEGPGSIEADTELLGRLAADLGYALRSLRTAREHRKARRHLEESERRFRQLFANGADAIMIADAEGRYVDVNPAASALFGRSREELLSMSVADLVVPEDEPDPGERYREFVATGGESGTFGFVRPDGERGIAEYNAFPLGPGLYASTLRDVTERYTLEARLAETAKMEAVGRLAGGVAHDFNNLLTAILSYAGFVRDELPAGDPRRDDIAEVLAAADRASGLVRQLLSFSRRQPIRPKNVDVNALIEETERLLRRTIGEDVELQTDLADGLEPVFIDPGQLHQVVMNLAVNARDAMPTGGELTIETRRLDDGGAELGPCVRLRVSDTGVGMDEQTRLHVFEPFFTTKEVGAGTGLGLATVYGIVTRAGGVVRIDSAPGEGARVDVVLPVAEGASEAADKERAVTAHLVGAETVLLVEDESRVRRAVSRILGRHGYRVVEAASGAEAVRLYRQRATAVDMVLCDVVMPKMSGPETVEALRGVDPSLGVLYMSGYTEDAIVHHGVVAGGVDLIMKPFGEAALLARVREILDRRKA